MSEDVASILNTENIEVFFKLYLLLYADDTVIFAEWPEKLQTALDTMKLYCDTWKLHVNTSKTEIVVFFKRKNKAKTYFYYNGESIEIVDDFSYLGIKFKYIANLVKPKSI